MKKKITIALIINVLIVATFFGFKSWVYKSKIDKLEEIGASFGYGMTDVLYVDLSNTEVDNEELNLLDIFSLEKIDLTNTKVTNLEPLHKQYVVDFPPPSYDEAGFLRESFTSGISFCDSRGDRDHDRNHRDRDRDDRHDVHRDDDHRGDDRNDREDVVLAHPSAPIIGISFHPAFLTAIFDESTRLI